MKLSGVRSISLLFLIFWCAFSQIQPLSRVRYETVVLATAGNELTAVTSWNAVHSQDVPVVIQPLDPGENVAGNIPAPAAANDCLLGVTQYKIEFPGGARKLVIDLEGDQDVDLYLRAGVPVAMEGGRILANFRSESGRSKERVSAPARGLDSQPGAPLLEAGSYFIAVTNCGPGVATYSLSAQILDPPADERVDLTFDGVEVGSIAAPDPGGCRVGRTQYAVSSSFDPCVGGLFWMVVIRADQKVNVYVRKGQPVTVENGIVMADSVTPSPANVQSIQLFQDTPGQSLFFIAVENCNSDVANYTVTPNVGIVDSFPPFIVSAFFEKKNLHVVGLFHDEGAIVSLDGEPQKTKFGGHTSDSHEILIAKKGKKKIDRHQTVRITVKRGDCTSVAFLFTRP